MKKFAILLLAAAFLLTGCVTTEKKELYPADILAEALNHEDHQIAFQAAKYLNHLEIEKELCSAFADKLIRTDNPILQLRGCYLKAQILQKGTEYDRCIDKLKNAAFSGSGNVERLVALEALFELNISPDLLETELLKDYFFSVTSSDEARIYCAALLCNSNRNTGLSWLEEVLSRSSSNSTIQQQVITVLKKFNNLPSYSLRTVEKIANNPVNDDQLRTAAIFILLTNKRIQWETAEKKLQKFSANEAELLPLYLTYSPDNGIPLIHQCAASPNKSLQLLAAWSELYFSFPVKEK